MIVYVLIKDVIDTITGEMVSSQVVSVTRSMTGALQWREHTPSYENEEKTLYGNYWFEQHYLIG